MIRVSDNKQAIKAVITITTINIDGLFRYWYVDSIKELHRWWWDEDYDGPSSEDEVVELRINGEKVDEINDYEDIVLRYGFDNEIEPGELEIEVIKGTPEYAKWAPMRD